MKSPARMLALAGTLGVAGLVAAAAHAEVFGTSGATKTDRAEARAVIELFTSQGCSSCPPADRMVAELADDRSVIAISVPIDYWDYLGWKDTLASPRHTARQRGYAARRGDREVYTPQVVVNGVAQALGSDRRAIENAIVLSHSRPGTLTVPVKIAANADQVEVTITPREESGQEGEVWICSLVRSIPVDIKRGENRGRTVTYHNVVRRWVRLGRWSGGGQNWSIPKAEIDASGADQIAVLVQAGNVENPGPIFGAATIPLR